MYTVGDKFPKFNLLSMCDKPISEINIENAFVNIDNSTYAGNWKIIFFYPKDFTFVCPTELAGFGELFDDFYKKNTRILACSVDSEFVHFAWRKNNNLLNNLPYPIMSDVKRELSNKLGILDEEFGVSKRALFIVDPEDIIKFVMVTDMNVGRNPQEVLRVLDALQTGELCQCGWKAGDKAIDIREASK